MTRRVKAIHYVIVLFSILSAFAFITHYYHSQVTDLKNEVSIAEEERDIYRETVEKMAITTASLDEMSQSEILSGYKDWLTKVETAKALTEQSDGNFKKNWALFLVNEAERYSIDPYIVYELIRVETGGTFDPNLKGPQTKYGQAHGLSQFMKNTAPWIADMANLPYDDDLLYDPYYSIQLSVVYLDFLHDHYGEWNKALTAYHRGMYGLEQYIEKNGHAKSWYAKEIQNKAEEYRLVAFND